MTPKKRAVIHQYHMDGLKISEISGKLVIPRKTVSNIVHRIRETGSAEAGQHTGRPRATTQREDLLIRRAVVKEPHMSSMQIKVECRTNVSTRTIRRRLSDEFGLRAYRAAKKPLLNTTQRKKRLNFCIKYKNWTVHDWCKVLFSDESTFCQFDGCASYVRRPRLQRYFQGTHCKLWNIVPRLWFGAAFLHKDGAHFILYQLGKQSTASCT